MSIASDRQNPYYEARFDSVWRGPREMSMNTETRMAIEQSTPMPQSSESGASVRYETKVISHWDPQALAEVNDAFTYEIAWMPERQCRRSFLYSVSKLA